MSEAHRIGEVTEAWALAQKIKTIYFKQTTSTNDIAKDQADSDDIVEHDIALYLADDQTKGRGRFDRQWETPKPGSSLLCSWSLVVGELPTPEFTLRAGLAIVTAAYATWPFLNWSLKAPNDLYINDKKVAGLLIETISQGNNHRLIFGLGLNVLSFPPKQTQATSVLSEMIKLKVPFIGDDWLLFCERMLFEIVACVNTSHEDFSEPVVQSILHYLNKNPLLTNKLQTIDEVIDQIER